MDTLQAPPVQRLRDVVAVESGTCKHANLLVVFLLVNHYT